MQAILSEKGKTFKGEKIHDENIGYCYVVYKKKIYNIGNCYHESIELFDAGRFIKCVHSSKIRLIKII